MTATAREPLDACPLWVTLHRHEPHPSRRVLYAGEEPSLFLHFHRTGLMVGLNGEESEALEGEAGARTFELLDTDALGLGLQAEDFAEGVSLCGGEAGHDGELFGWHCEAVTVLGADGTGTRLPLTEPTAIAAWLTA